MLLHSRWAVSLSIESFICLPLPLRLTILSRKLRLPGPETPQRLLPVPQPRHSDTIDYGTAITLVQERTLILRATDHRHRLFDRAFSTRGSRLRPDYPPVSPPPGLTAPFQPDLRKAGINRLNAISYNPDNYLFCARTAHWSLPVRHSVCPHPSLCFRVALLSVQ